MGYLSDIIRTFDDRCRSVLCEHIENFVLKDLYQIVEQLKIILKLTQPEGDLNMDSFQLLNIAIPWFNLNYSYLLWSSLSAWSHFSLFIETIKNQIILVFWLTKCFSYVIRQKQINWIELK